MKIKAIDLLNMSEGLSYLSDKEVDLSTSIIIAENINALSVAKNVIDTKRNDLILKHATKDENGEVKRNGDSIEITDMQKFTSEMEDLLSSEIEVNVSFISKSALSDIKIAPKYISPLIPILKDDEVK